MLQVIDICLKGRGQDIVTESFAGDLYALNRGELVLESFAYGCLQLGVALEAYLHC